MTREEIIELAKEAKATTYTNRHYPESPYFTFSPEQLNRFVALVAKNEREMCVTVVENQALQYSEPVWALRIISCIQERG